MFGSSERSQTFEQEWRVHHSNLVGSAPRQEAFATFQLPLALAVAGDRPECIRASRFLLVSVLTLCVL